jgi:hypothetical protein
VDARIAAAPGRNPKESELAMAAGTRHLSFPQVESGANRLNKEKEDIETRLTHLKAMIDQLVSSDFVTDRASGEFQQDYDRTMAPVRSCGAWRA